MITVSLKVLNFYCPSGKKVPGTGLNSRPGSAATALGESQSLRVLSEQNGLLGNLNLLPALRSFCEVTETC